MDRRRPHNAGGAASVSEVFGPTTLSNPEPTTCSQSGGMVRGVLGCAVEECRAPMTRSLTPALGADRLKSGHRLGGRGGPAFSRTTDVALLSLQSILQSAVAPVCHPSPVFSDYSRTRSITHT